MTDPKDTAAPFDDRLLNATAETALAAIKEANERAPELVEAWIRRNNGPAVYAVAENGEGAPRKAARRGVNVLRSRGIKVEAPPRVSSLSGVDSARGTSYEAWMVSPDAAGTVLLVVAGRSATSRSEVGFFYVHDAFGLHAVNVGSVSGSGLKDALKRAGANVAPAVRVPIEYARQRIAQARQLSKQRGQPEPLGLTNARTLIEPVPSEPVPHPFDAEGLELSDDDAKELARHSATLHSLREFRSWLPDRSAVDEMLAEVGQQLQGDTDPQPEKAQQLIKAAVEAATDRYFGPERRAALLGRMKDAAFSVLSNEGETRALDVVAAMNRIAQAGLITDAPREIPFLLAFFDKAVATLAYQGGGKLQIPVRRDAASAPGAEAGAGV